MSFDDLLALMRVQRPPITSSSRIIRGFVAINPAGQLQLFFSALRWAARPARTPRAFLQPHHPELLEGDLSAPLRDRVGAGGGRPTTVFLQHRELSPAAGTFCQVRAIPQLADPVPAGSR